MSGDHQAVPEQVARHGKAPAQDVDGEHAQAADGLCAHDRLHALVQDGVPRVARALRVGGHLPVSHHMRHTPGTCARLAAPPRGTWRAQGDAKDLACACDASPNNAARCSEPTPCQCTRQPTGSGMAEGPSAMAPGRGCRSCRRWRLRCPCPACAAGAAPVHAQEQELRTSYFACDARTSRTQSGPAEAGVGHTCSACPMGGPYQQIGCCAKRILSSAAWSQELPVSGWGYM